LQVGALVPTLANAGKRPWIDAAGYQDGTGKGLSPCPDDEDACTLSTAYSCGAPVRSIDPHQARLAGVDGVAVDLDTKTVNILRDRRLLNTEQIVSAWRRRVTPAPA
jgi:hypothetical protein